MEDTFLVCDHHLTPANAVVALIVVDEDRYLMQLRNQKAGIFYPGHWGLFSGAVERGEDRESALRRELHEELGVDFSNWAYFTEFTFDFSFQGLGPIWRRYYTLPLSTKRLPDLVLGEGESMKALSAREALLDVRSVPYDAFCIWLRRNSASAGR